MSIFLIIQLVIFNFITRTGADRLPTGNVACGIRNLGRFCLWNHCGIRLSVLCFRFSLSLVPRSTKGLVESGHPGLWKVVSLFKLFFLGGGGDFWDQYKHALLYYACRTHSSILHNLYGVHNSKSAVH